MNKMDLNKAEKMLEEKTFFRERISLETGEIVADDFDPELSVVVEFNEEIADNFSRISQAILESRGVKNPDEIDRNDPDVRTILEKRLKRKREGLKGREARFTVLPEQEVSSVINGAIRSHTPHFRAALVQTIIYLILVNDLFYEEKSGAIATRFELEIPDDYWTNINRVIQKNSGSIIDKVLGSSQDYIVASPYYDPENSLERMIAFVTVFVEEHPELSNVITERYLNKIMAYITLGGKSVLRKLDNFQTFTDVLDELLPANVGKESSDEQREVIGARVGVVTKETEVTKGRTTKQKEENVSTNTTE